MQEQVLSPRVQNADEANLRAQPIWVGRNFKHGVGAGAEKQIVQNPGIAQAEGIQLVWQGEYDVEVRNVE
jgi:hypothetical protein